MLFIVYVVGIVSGWVIKDLYDTNKQEIQWFFRKIK